MKSRTRESKSRGLVFVAMPFEAPHSKAVWEIVEFACKRFALAVTRADSFSKPRQILTDIREQIERAEICIADLTGLNPNVLYEVGLAHAYSEAVILMCKKGERLPFDLSGMRTILYDVASVSGQEALVRDLLAAIEALRPTAEVPTRLIKGKLARTRSVVTDLKTLASYPDQTLGQETVWFSGFLSTFAIGARERFESDAYRKALLAEKLTLMQLAERGCAVRCVVTPPRRDMRMVEGENTAKARLVTLLEFLQSGPEKALRNIEFVVSHFRQKNLYVIGHICTSEGFKTGLTRGYDLTLRQSGPEAVGAAIAAQEALFRDLRRFTVETFGKGSVKELRSCVIRALSASLAEIEAR